VKNSPSTSIFMILIAFFIRVLPLDLFLPRPRPLPPATRAASSCSLLRIGLFSHRTSSFCSWIFPFWLIECIDSFWNAIYSHVTLLITYPVLLVHRHYYQSYRIDSSAMLACLTFLKYCWQRLQ
jgi:hypothetical protein